MKSRLNFRIFRFYKLVIAEHRLKVFLESCPKLFHFRSRFRWLRLGKEANTSEKLFILSVSLPKELSLDNSSREVKLDKFLKV